MLLPHGIPKLMNGVEQTADQPETMYRCAGMLHAVSGSNMWSWST